MRTFEELGVMPEICKAISELGFEYPMPVQEEVIPYLLGNGNDVIALAQTGTGKTAAFGLPIIQKVNSQQPYAQALILSPTRELCLQIADDLVVLRSFEINVVQINIAGHIVAIDQVPHQIPCPAAGTAADVCKLQIFYTTVFVKHSCLPIILLPPL